MTTQVLEGTWEEITRHAEDLVGRNVRLIVLDNKNTRQPNKKALDVIRRVREKQKDMSFTGGEKAVEIVRGGREGEMFDDESVK